MRLYPSTSLLNGNAHTHVGYLPSSFSSYPQHSALLRGLDHTFSLSLLLWALSFRILPTLVIPVLPTQTPQLDSHERPQPEGYRRCAKLYNMVVFGNPKFPKMRIVETTNQISKENLSDVRFFRTAVHNLRNSPQFPTGGHVTCGYGSKPSHSGEHQNH